MGKDVLPAAPVSCCGKFVIETESNGRKVVTQVTPANLRGKPARDLTVAEARRLVSFLVCRGDIELTGRYLDFKCKNDGSLEITSPPLQARRKFHEAEKGPDGKPTGKRVFDASQDFFAPETIDIKAVVKLKDLPGEPTIALNNLNDTKTPPTSQVCLNIDFRNMVACTSLSSAWSRDSEPRSSCTPRSARAAARPPTATTPTATTPAGRRTSRG